MKRYMGSPKMGNFMSTVQNKEVVAKLYRYLREYWRTGDPQPFDEVIASDMAVNWVNVPPATMGLEGFKQSLPPMRSAFPDMQVTVGEMVAESDKVMYTETYQGTHTGDFMGIPATGKKVDVTDTHIDVLANGKIVERRGFVNMPLLMIQLGVSKFKFPDQPK